MHGIGEGKDIYRGPIGHRRVLASLTPGSRGDNQRGGITVQKRFFPQYACCASFGRD